MKKIAILGLAVFMSGILLLNSGLAQAVSAHQHFIFGGASTQNLASQTGAKSKITIVIPQTFSGQDVDHNWHLQAKDSSGLKHLIGYFVSSSSPSTAKVFVEVWQGSTKVLDYQGTGSVGNNGDQKYFAMHNPGGTSAWQYYVDNNPQTQYNSNGRTLNTFDLLALAEKICQNSPYCTKDQGGPMPSVNMPNALMYTSSTSYLGTWNAVTSAQAYYEYKNADGSGATGSGAQSEMCQPMSMKGKDQDGSLSTNQIISGNNVVTTCTTANVALWP